MKAVEKWAQDKIFLLALIGPQTAAAAQDMHEALRYIKDRRLYSLQFPLPHLHTWFTLYHSHRRIYENYTKFIYEFSPYGKDLVAFACGIQELNKTLKNNPDKKFTFTKQEIEDGHNFLTNLKTASIEELKQDNSNNPCDPVEKARFLHYVKNNELDLSFFFLVQSPCWLLYQVSSATLYRKARLGDISSLDKLLRLDPLMLHDPTIGREIQKLRFKNRTNDYEKLLEAARKPVKVKTTRSKLKASYAALISSIASSFNHPINEPEIRDLYDALAKDNLGKEIDTDLPESSETFSKAIQRDRKTWQPILNPDKKM